MSKTIKSAELFYQEGTSDKVYNVALVEVEQGLYTVEVEWGRRGASLNQGTKAVKVPLKKADKVYDRVVQQKIGKGYEEIAENVRPAAVAPPEGKGSGSKAANRPGARARMGQAAQLLNAIDEAEAEALLGDKTVVAQQKLDGVRLLAHVGRDELPDVVVTNRQGQVTSAAPEVLDALAELAGGTILDGELVGDDYWLFDILLDRGDDIRPLGYLERHEHLSGLDISAPLHLVQTAATASQKRSLFRRLQKENAEGIVFKRVDAPYRPGRPASGGNQLKYKFVKSADVTILENAGNAYLMGVFDDDGALHEIGKVFAGTTNETRRELDQLLGDDERPVAEVRYLYATDDRQLYQPVFCQLRQDKEPEECLLGQLEFTSREVLSIGGAESRPPRGRDDETKKVLTILGALPPKR